MTEVFVDPCPLCQIDHESSVTHHGLPIYQCPKLVYPDVLFDADHLMYLRAN